MQRWKNRCNKEIETARGRERERGKSEDVKSYKNIVSVVGFFFSCTGNSMERISLMW